MEYNSQWKLLIFNKLSNLNSNEFPIIVGNKGSSYPSFYFELDYIPYLDTYKVIINENLFLLDSRRNGNTFYLYANKNKEDDLREYLKIIGNVDNKVISIYDPMTDMYLCSISPTMGKYFYKWHIKFSYIHPFKRYMKLYIGDRTLFDSYYECDIMGKPIDPDIENKIKELFSK